MNEREYQRILAKIHEVRRKAVQGYSANAPEDGPDGGGVAGACKVISLVQKTIFRPQPAPAAPRPAGAPGSARRSAAA